MDYKEEAKIWMKKPKFGLRSQNWMKIELKQEKILFYIHDVDECRHILLHYNILCSLASQQI
jgi:hypothetical protein